ncbi:MAG: T9SS type A sorting domain-containing protein [Flavobacteriaceae bacterium]|nr:T9SS type A sorting domain-containing protein [Flavobacteriaceae bacterium]
MKPTLLLCSAICFLMGFCLPAHAQLTFTYNLVDNSQTTANAANSVTAADFDGDGDIDIVGASFQSDVFMLYRNDGAGNFSPEIIEDDPAVANGARFVRAADINQDGFMDVIGTSSSADVYLWFQNDGSGFFTTIVIDSGSLANEAYGMDAADFNDDGNIDLVGGANFGNAVAIYANDGTGTFTLFSNLSGGAITDGVRAVEVADLDGDTDPDILVAANDGDTYSWFENDGSGIFTNHIISNSANANGASQIKAADLDGDGDLDVVGASNLADVFLWFENDGAQNFTERIIDATTYSDGPRGVTLTDLDQDGDIDVITASITQDVFAFYENDGSGVFSPNLISDVQAETSGAFSVTTADVDGDAVEDVIVAANGADAVGWYKVDGVLNIDEQSFEHGLSLYPNPVNDVLTIQSNSKTVQEVHLVDMLGKSYPLALTIDHTISLEGFSAGVYQLIVISDQGESVHKIIKR